MLANALLILGGASGSAEEGKEAKQPGFASFVIPPGFQFVHAVTLNEAARLTLRLTGPDAARTRLRVSHGATSTAEPEDHTLDGSVTSLLRIPNAQAGVWRVAIVPAYAEGAAAWARSLAADYEHDPRFRQRPFPDSADRQVTLKWEIRPPVSYKPNAGLKVIRTGGPGTKAKGGRR